MKKKTGLIKQLSPHLFWDVPADSLDTQKNESFIIQRVMEYGLWNDWQLLKKFYGIETIVADAVEFKQLEPKALAFISNVSGVPKEKFRCYISKQLTPRHWNY